MNLRFELVEPKTQKPRLLWNFSTTKSESYDQCMQQFQGKVVRLPDEKASRIIKGVSGSYMVKFDGTRDVVGAILVCLQKTTEKTAPNVWFDDHQYQIFSKHLLDLCDNYAKRVVREGMPIEAEDRPNKQTLESFKALLLEKNARLNAQSAKLNALCKMVAIPGLEIELGSQTDSLANLVAANKQLMQKNTELYRNIILAARKKCVEYNKIVVKAAIAPQKKLEEKRLGVSHGHYSYIEASIFKLPEEDEEHFHVDNILGEDEAHILTLPPKAIEVLAANVKRITGLKDETTDSVVSATAMNTHRFNSTDSPLIAIIYDRELSAAEKLKLLDALAQMSPLVATDNTESNQNINKVGRKPGDEKGDAASPLHHAVMAGTLAAVQTLLKYNPQDSDENQGHWAGSDKDGQPILMHGCNPLHLAVAIGDIDKVRVLLAHIDVNKHDLARKTPLFYAKTVAMYDLLLTKGAKTNLRSRDDGSTPLHAAVFRNDSAAVHRLLENKAFPADPNIVDSSGNSPLHLAAKIAFSHSDRPFWQQSNVDAKQNNLSIIEALLQHEADPNCVNETGYTPLLATILGVTKFSEMRACPLRDHVHMHHQIQLLCGYGARADKFTSMVTEQGKFVTNALYALYVNEHGGRCRIAPENHTHRACLARLLITHYEAGLTEGQLATAKEICDTQRDEGSWELLHMEGLILKDPKNVTTSSKRSADATNLSPKTYMPKGSGGGE